jgi:hypothetical protein
MTTTAQEFAALLAEYRAARSALDAIETGELEPTVTEQKAGERFRQAYRAVIAARPSDAASMAAQLRFLVASQEDREAEMLAAIADRLDEMAAPSIE